MTLLSHINFGQSVLIEYVVIVKISIYMILNISNIDLLVYMTLLANT